MRVLAVSCISVCPGTAHTFYEAYSQVIDNNFAVQSMRKALPPRAQCSMNATGPSCETQTPSGDLTMFSMGDVLQARLLYRSMDDRATAMTDSIYTLAGLFGFSKEELRDCFFVIAHVPRCRVQATQGRERPWRVRRMASMAQRTASTTLQNSMRTAVAGSLEEDVEILENAWRFLRRLHIWRWRDAERFAASWKDDIRPGGWNIHWLVRRLLRRPWRPSWLRKRVLRHGLLRECIFVGH